MTGISRTGDVVSALASSPLAPTSPNSGRYDVDVRDLISRPHPRAVYYDVPADVVAATSELFPTTREIDGLAEVRFADWDVLIAGSSLSDCIPPDADLFVVAFSDGELGPAAGTHNGVVRRTYSHLGAISVAAQFAVPVDLPRSYAALVPRLLTTVDTDEPHSCLLAGSRRVDLLGGTIENVASADVLRPVLATSDGFPIAAWWQRPDAGITLSLPNDLSPGDQAEWIRAAITSWARVDPVRFPVSDQEWARRESWMTVEELAAVEKVRATSEERAIGVALFDERLAAAEAELLGLQATGDMGPRLLLTGTGDALVAQVAATLRLLGFGVRDMDEVWPENDRREDLRITDDDDAEWIAIGEVKGFARSGPKAADLITLIGRFRKRFVQEEQREPSALWYVVNQRSLTPPDERPRGAGVETGDLEAFASESGLIVDTIDLFELARSVTAGERTADDVRGMLRSARGMLRRG